jgi:hypothetical protein
MNSANAFIALSISLTFSLANAAPAAVTAPIATAPAKVVAPAKDSVKTVTPSVATPPAATAATAVKDTVKPASTPAPAPAGNPPVVAKDTVKPASAAAPTAATVTPPISDTAKSASPAATPASPVSASPVAVAADSSASDSTAADSSKAGRPKKRKRIVRETTVNSIDELKGRYRSPKKALFMSLVVPGLGQAYVGQNWFNYTRGAVYFMTDVVLAFGWHHYVVDRQDAQIAKYRKFADNNWTQTAYEDSLERQLTSPFDAEKFSVVNPHRQSYCDAVQNRETNKGNALYAGCTEPQGTGYSAFKGEYDDETWGGVDSISTRRAQFVNPHQFYEIIGKEVEFINGWKGPENIQQQDSTFYVLDQDGIILKDAAGKPLPATKASQQEYIQMRAKANDYARMQAYFLGGMVVNHIISALDAALTAHYHNKDLYQTEVRWYDRVHLDGGFAWQGYQPATAVTARVTF